MTVANVRVLLVDDHLVLTDMLRQRLAEEPDVTVVGVAASAAEALAFARTAKPDVLLMDIEMPGLDAFTAAESIVEATGARVMFLSGHTSDRYIDQALQLGAMAYLTKTGSPDAVIHAIREVAAGRTVFSKEIAERIVVDRNGPRLGRRNRSRMDLLSERERLVVRYVADGLANKQIARMMDISARTVDAHMRRIMDKLNVRGRVDIARFAIREGLAQP